MLQRGNIFRIEKGAKIFVKVPNKFVFSTNLHPSEENYYVITVGEHLPLIDSVEKQLITQMKEDIRTSITNIFKNNEIPIDQESDNINEFLDSLKGIVFDTSCFIGEYVVTSTGISSTNGWEVFAKEMDNGNYDKYGKKISFIQTDATGITLLGDMLQF